MARWSGTKYGLAISIDSRAAEIARQYITLTDEAPVSGELITVCSASFPTGSSFG